MWRAVFSGKDMNGPGNGTWHGKAKRVKAGLKQASHLDIFGKKKKELYLFLFYLQIIFSLQKDGKKGKKRKEKKRN